MIILLFTILLTMVPQFVNAGEVVNVLTDCGVIGDGVTDDSSTVQACIDKNKGKTLYFSKHRPWNDPIPDYYFTSSIFLREHGTQIMGSGFGQGREESQSTRFKFTAGVTGIIINNDCQGCGIKDLQIGGSEPWNSSDPAHCILPAGYGTDSGSTGTSTADGILIRANFTRVENVFVYGFGRHGINLDGKPPHTAHSAHIINVTSWGNRGSGFYNSQGRESNASSFFQVRAYVNQLWGFEDNSTSDALYSPLAHTNHVDGTSNGSPHNISTALRTGNTVTLTTMTDHNFQVGNAIVVSGVTDNGFDGIFFVASVPSRTSVTYSQASLNASSSGGTAKLASCTQVWDLARVDGGGYKMDKKVVTSVLVQPYVETDNGQAPNKPFGTLNKLNYSTIVLGGAIGTDFDWSLTPNVITTTTGGMTITPTYFVDNSNYPFYNILTASRSGGNVTLTMTTPHKFRKDSVITVKDVLDPSFNSNFIVVSASSTTVTYSQSEPDASSSGGVAKLATSEGAIKVRVGAGWGQNDNTAILVYDQDSGIIPMTQHGIEFRKTKDTFHKNPSDPDIPWFGWRVQQASDLLPGLTNYPLLLAYGQTAESNSGVNPPIWIPNSFYLGNALTGRNQFFKSSALPSSGTHKRGDWAFNSSPTSGGVAAWVAVQDGTPGTWEPVSLGSGAGQVLSTFMPGALTTTWTGATWTPDKAITVTRIEAQAKTAPVGCTTNALVNITDGTRSQNVSIASSRNDSGPMTQDYDTGRTLSIGVSTAASGCTEAPADVNVLIQYRIQ